MPLRLAGWADNHTERERVVATLMDWLGIPSISAQPDHAGDVRRSADFTARLLAGGGALPVDLKFLVEGEEEIGSPNFEALLEIEHHRLACDVVVLAFGVHLRTAKADLHAPTERLMIDKFWEGILAAGELLGELGELHV